MVNYEQKYKAALERARKFATDLPNGRNDRLYHVWDLESIFPELKKSEDERIRKELIEHIKANRESGFNLFRKFSPDDIIAWLEKQCEQKGINLVEILKHYPRETELYSPLYGKLWLAEVDEKHEIIICYKHRLDEGCTRAILEQEETVSFYSNGTTGLPDFSISKDCMLFLYDVEKQDGPMPAWSEEDERIYNEILDFFLGDYETRCVTIDKQRSFGYWLKSLKERIKK